MLQSTYNRRLKRTQAPESEPMPADPRVNILLVDDRRDNLVALESVLGELGQNLVTATSGTEALRRLLDEDFAVILLDVQMPGMDGFETATLIRSRERSRHTPIVFLTAINKTEGHVSRGYSIGAVDYVFKPFEPEVLRAKVAAFVDLRKKTDELRREVEQRRRAEEEVRQLSGSLERRVRVRTRELEAANKELQHEIAERKRIEEERAVLLAREQEARRTAEAAQQRLVFLGEASALLASSLDYQLTLERVAQLAVPHFADFCIVDLVDDDRRLRRVATAHAHPEHAGLMRLLESESTPNWELLRPVAQALQSGKSELASHIDEAWLQQAIQDEEQAGVFRQLRVRAHLVVPLLTRGHTLGAITFGLTASAGDERTYGSDDVELAEDLARRAAAAIDNARLFWEVQEAGRRKDEFLAMLAHELRTPLAAVSNADYVLGEVGGEDSRVLRLREIIRRQTRHLSRLVDDLLDISRITRGKIELRKEPVDLGLIVQRAVETTSAIIAQRQHELTVVLPDVPLQVEADATRLEQVLSNLLNNAAKYTEPGGQIRLTAELLRDDTLPQHCRPLPTGEHKTPEPDRPGQAWAVLRVRDSGMGIHPDLLPRVFDLFTQAERAADRAEGGLGIGLALVRNLVQMHGGRVEVFSDGTGLGSEFVVYLPALTGVSIPSLSVRTAPPAADSAAHTGCRTLIVEDNPDAADTLSEILELWGHEVRVVPQGFAAIEAAPEFRPRVVFLDIGLPGMDGYEVARRLRAWETEEDVRAGGSRREGTAHRRGGDVDAKPGARMFLVALTGYGQEEDRRRSEEAGFDLHLTKPVDPAQLRRLLETESGE